MKWKRRWIES